MANKYRIRSILNRCLIVIYLTVLAACSTGIESTKTIKMTKDDRRMSEDSPEEVLAGMISSQSIADWKPGKRFLVVDNKASLIYEGFSNRGAQPMQDSIAGMILRFEGVNHRATPGGTAVTVVRLLNGEHEVSYNTGRSMASSDSLFSGLDMPFMIDLDMVQLADSLLAGLDVWTNTRLCYDNDDNMLEGEKFRAVKIVKVVPGNALFPLRVFFTASDGKPVSVFMNVASKRSSGNESRTFASLFLLEAPKLKYPSISPEFWDRICRGDVAIGMNKTECRLALGSPSDVISGHDWDSLLDVWSYSDGSYLKFQDGLLVNFRK